MIANYWRVTWQNLLRHKLYTLINVLGLTIAVASSIIIFLYARNELSYDAFHANADRIQLVYKERNTAQGIQELDDTWVPLLGVMQEQFPAIANGARTFDQEGRWIEIDGTRKFSETVTYADPALLEIFTFPLTRGDAGSALSGRNTMVLSSEAAARYFGSEDPLGKVVTINFTDDYVVTGVLDPVPQNSIIRPDIIVPFESLLQPEELEAANANWGTSFLQTFLLLDENANVTSLETGFRSMVASLFGEDGANGARNMQLKLWPLRSLHDRFVQSDATSYVLLAIAFSVVLIACINFMNLSVARSLERAREVGVRKTLGSRRGQLMLLFFIEPLVITGLALTLAVELASVLLPVFNSLYGLELALDPGGDPVLLAMLVTTGFAAALLSGCYPAFILSGLRSVDTLKGNLKSSRGGIRVRNGLSLLQFSLAIILITGIIAAWQQIRYMQNQSLNFDPEQVLVIPVNLGDFSDRDMAASQLEVFKNEIRNIPGISSVASSMSVPGDYVGSNTFAEPEGWLGDEPLRMLYAVTDENYFETYGMTFIEGENFSAETGNGASSIILNETAMRDIGWDSAVGKQVNDWTVVGVVRDFHYQSLQDGIRPIIHVYEPPEGNARHNFISVKLGTTDVQPTLAALEAQWELLDPSRAFTYYFVEDRFATLHQDVSNTGKILGYFALLSIFIANLGLLGLTSYSVVQRTREIGIRKVLGSTVPDITLLLSRQFIKPILLANLLAWPIAWFAIRRWLEGFAYHIELDWLIFPVAGISILVFALLTISAQSAKAAGINPVQALRSE